MGRSGSPAAYKTVMAMKDHGWLLAVAACVELADEFGPRAELAGSWIFKRASQKRPRLWLPSLQPLVRHGLLARVRTARGRSRVYYRVTDLNGSRRALLDRGIPLTVRTAAVG